MPLPGGGPILGSAFSSSGPPAVHKDTHKSGGADAFVAADVLESAARTLRTPLRNETGGSLPKGTLVAVTGFSIAEGRPTVAIADKDDSNARPAVAVTEASVGNNANFEGLVLGILAGLDTSAFSVNDQLALGDAGAVSRPPPDTDPFTGEIQLVGSTVRIDASVGSIYFTLSSGLLPMTAAQFFVTKETSPTGNVSGGEVTRATGLNVDVAAGSGFVNDDTDVFRVPYSAVVNLALAANDTNFIFVDKNGLVQASTSLPALGNNIVLADAITDGSSVLLLANHQVLLRERPAIVHEYMNDVIGNVVVSGLTTTKDAIPLRLDVDAGTYYTRDFKVTVPAGANPITFTYWFRDGSGGFTRVASSTLIDKDNFDDGSGVLAALLTTEFKKDLLFVVFTATGLVEYHVFYGQEKFTSQSEAEAGNLPAADSDVIANAVRSGGIVQEGAAATIASVVDVRPFIGQLSPGTTAVSDHGLLSGLADDDHALYLPVTGVRPMTGPLDMGANAITNVGNVDGVDVSAHAARHTDGSDDVDGDQLDIDFTPTNYAPDITPPEAADVDDLAAHLAGIDTMLELSKSITIENPTSAEDISMFFTNKSITIKEIRAVLRGSATPSVTMTIRHGTDRDAAGAEVVTGGSVITSITTGSDITAFNDETIVADSFVWLETTAQSGTVDELQITIFYKKT